MGKAPSVNACISRDGWIHLGGHLNPLVGSGCGQQGLTLVSRTERSKGNCYLRLVRGVGCTVQPSHAQTKSRRALSLISFNLFFISILFLNASILDGGLLSSDYTPPRLKIEAMSRSNITIS